MSMNIVVAGPRGNMGSTAIQMITEADDLHLVAVIDRKNNGKTMKDINTLPQINVPIYESLQQCLDQVETHIFLDLTIPLIGFEHTKIALENKICSVVGTTGFTDEQITELTNLASRNSTGCIIAPNFAIGAILMMQFAETAAKYFPDVEIIEKHHDEKIDAPSGTAIKTADLIKQVRAYKQQGHLSEYETIAGARGADIDGMKIHSVRLPGLVAHQEVIFGGLGQTLTIKHDSYTRESFMDGLMLAMNKVRELNGLVHGLENIL